MDDERNAMAVSAFISRKAIWTGVLAVVFIVCVTMFMQPYYWGSPRCVIGQTEVDFGEIPSNRMSETTIPVYNQGNGILRIFKTTTSCGCVKASIQPDSINPGRKGDLRIIADPAEMAGFETQKTIEIQSNDPQKPYNTISVCARVEPEFVLEPPTLDFGKIEKGKEIQAKVILRQTGIEPIDILEISKVALQKDDYFDCGYQLLPRDQWRAPDRTEYLVSIKAKPDMPSGRFKQQVLIKTTCSRLPSYQYTIQGEIGVPYTIRIASDKTPVVCGSTIKEAFVITAPSSFSITDLLASDSHMRVAGVPQEESKACSIDIQVEPGASKGLQNVKVSFVVHMGDCVYQDVVMFRRLFVGQNESQAESTGAGNRN